MVVVCKECGKTFTRKYNIDRHMEKLHSNGNNSDEDDTDKDMESEIDEESDSSNEEEEEIDVWKVIDEEMTEDEDGDLLEIVKRNIRFC